MTLVSPDQIGLNSEITSAGVNTPINQLASVINGNIDSTNISSVSGAKINAGTIPASALDTNANPETRLSESLGDFVAEGLIWSAVSSLNGTMTAGVAYITGKRLAVSAVASHSFTASRDTYVYLDSTGTIQYDPRTNGSARPETPANTLLLSLVVTNATAVTATYDMRRMTTGSGWQNITLSAGFTGTDAQYRKINNIVYMRGSVKRTAGNFPTTYTQFSTLPPGARPTRYFRAFGGAFASGSQNFMGLYMDVDGSIGGFAVGTGADSVYLGAITYPVD